MVMIKVLMVLINTLLMIMNPKNEEPDFILSQIHIFIYIIFLSKKSVSIFFWK